MGNTTKPKPSSDDTLFGNVRPYADALSPTKKLRVMFDAMSFNGVARQSPIVPECLDVPAFWHTTPEEPYTPEEQAVSQLRQI